MRRLKQNKVIDTAIFIIHTLFLCFMLYQLHISNFKYETINEYSSFKAIVIFIVVFFINSFVYFQFDNPKVFRISILFEFYVAYMIGLIICKSLLNIYAPIAILLCVSFYSSKKIYTLHLLSFLGVITGYICFIIYSSINSNSIAEIVSQEYIIHLLSCLTLSFCLTFTNDIISKKGIKDYFTEPLRILSITALESTCDAKTEDITNTLNDLTTKTNLMSDIITDLKADWSIASSNSKSVSRLSSKLNKDINSISNITNELNKYTMKAKSDLSSTSELFNSMLRTSLNINSTHKNLICSLDNLDDNTNLLKDILIELDNLSIVTTHLSNKTTIEANQEINQDVMNLIVTEFHNYSDEIRNTILRMSTIFEKMTTNYYACKTEVNNSDNLLASNSLIINDLFKSIEAINSQFNNILSSTSQLESLLDTASYKSRNLTADSAELHNAVHQFGKVSFSLSKVNKSNLPKGKYTSIRYLKQS